jgi:hypothetical protein
LATGHAELIQERYAESRDGIPGRLPIFESRPLLGEIGCALGKAQNVVHLKGGVALTH